jgi:hypothetical protein
MLFERLRPQSELPRDGARFFLAGERLHCADFGLSPFALDHGYSPREGRRPPSTKKLSASLVLSLVSSFRGVVMRRLKSENRGATFSNFRLKLLMGNKPDRCICNCGKLSRIVKFS